MRSRSFVTGFLLAAGSGLAAVVFRRRSSRRRDRAELYFGDGTMVSLYDGSAGAGPLLAHARELLSAAR